MSAQLRLFFMTILFSFSLSTECFFFNKNDIVIARDYLKEKCSAVSVWGMISAVSVVMQSYSWIVPYLPVIDTSLKAGMMGCSGIAKMATGVGFVKAAIVAGWQISSPVLFSTGVKLLPIAPYVGCLCLGGALVHYKNAMNMKNNDDDITEKTEAGMKASQNEWQDIVFRWNFMTNLFRNHKKSDQKKIGRDADSDKNQVGNYNPFNLRPQDFVEDKVKILASGSHEGQADGHGGCGGERSNSHNDDKEKAEKKTQRDEKKKEKREKKEKDNQHFSQRIEELFVLLKETITKVDIQEAGLKLLFSKQQEKMNELHQVSCGYKEVCTSLTQTMNAVLVRVNTVCDLLEKQHAENVQTAKLNAETMSQYNRANATVAQESQQVLSSLVKTVHCLNRIVADSSAYDLKDRFFCDMQWRSMGSFLETSTGILSITGSDGPGGNEGPSSGIYGKGVND